MRTSEVRLRQFVRMQILQESGFLSQVSDDSEDLMQRLMQRWKDYNQSLIDYVEDEETDLPLSDYVDENAKNDLIRDTHDYIQHHLIDDSMTIDEKQKVYDDFFSEIDETSMEGTGYKLKELGDEASDKDQEMRFKAHDQEQAAKSKSSSQKTGAGSSGSSAVSPNMAVQGLTAYESGGTDVMIVPTPGASPITVRIPVEWTGQSDLTGFPSVGGFKILAAGKLSVRDPLYRSGESLSVIAKKYDTWYHLTNGGIRALPSATEAASIANRHI